MLSAVLFILAFMLCVGKLASGAEHARSLQHIYILQHFTRPAVSQFIVDVFRVFIAHVYHSYHRATPSFPTGLSAVARHSAGIPVVVAERVNAPEDMAAGQVCIPMDMAAERVICSSGHSREASVKRLRCIGKMTQGVAALTSALLKAVQWFRRFLQSSPASSSSR